MALPNPSINPPLLHASSTRRSPFHLRSPSRSPVRPQHFDPLLRDLSPTATLRAIAAPPGASVDSHLARCIEGSTPAQRALGTRAAQTCLCIRSWARELESWKWPGTFESLAGRDGLAQGEDQCSIPADTVRAYEQRLDELTKQLDLMDIEELKDIVLSQRADTVIHTKDGTSMIGPSASFKTLDDFTTLATATILQTLPYLSRVHMQMDTWSLRLSILRSAPDFLIGLRCARSTVEEARSDLSTSGAKEETRISRAGMEQSKSIISNELSALGRQLDGFLDSLEGRPETVPDSWIDGFEALEKLYGEWVVQAERDVLRVESLVTPDVSSSIHSPSRPGTSRTLDENRSPTKGIDVDPISSDDSPNFSVHSSPNSVDLTPLEKIRARAAFFSGDVDTVISLNKSKSPPVVRPFEHASNAFTQLFKKSGNSDGSRTRSSPSLRRSFLKKDRNSKSPKAEAGSPSSNGRTLHVDHVGRELFQPISNMDTENLNADRQHPDAAMRRRPQNQKQSGWPSSPTTPQESGRPETRYPSRTLSSPFHSPEKDFATSKDDRSDDDDDTMLPLEPEYPDNWPLSNEASPQISGENTGTSSSSNKYQHGKPTDLPSDAAAIPTDAFEGMFVDTLSDYQGSRPSSRQKGHRRRPKELIISVRNTQDSYRSTTYPEDDEPSSGNSGVLDLTGLPNETSYTATPRTTVGWRTLRPVSTVDEEPGTPEDERSLNESESSDEEGRSIAGSTTMSVDTRKMTVGSLSNLLTRNSPYLLEHTTAEARGVQRTRSESALRRASSTSIESFPRSQLKRVDVQPLSSRHSSSSLALPSDSAPHSATESLRSHSPSRLTIGLPPESSMTYSTYDGQNLLSAPVDLTSLPTSPISPDCSPSLPKTRGLVPPRANTESSGINGVTDKGRPISTLPKFVSQPASPTSPISPSKKGGDNFDRHVSAVLDRVHAPIRFKARPGAETPLGNRETDRTFPGLKAKNSKQTLRPVPGITLVPAEPSPRKSRPGVDEVKVYHLQTGKDEPIKLFVRLVGEDARVMVRVGGGWADLADYLRQFAEHHGSKTLADGAVEVQPASGRLTPTNGGSSGNSGNRLAVGTRRVFSMPTDSFRAKTLRPTTPLSNKTVYGANRDLPGEPDVNHFDTLPVDTGPKHDAASKVLLRPSSSHASTANSSQTPLDPGSTSKTVIGLAGPSSGKKAELPESKARWVEDMLGRAKASAEKRKEDGEKAERERYFGDMGRVGATRRLMFRSHSSNYSSNAPGAG